MEFLGVGPLELFFIIIIALIILGPKDMVKAGRTLGKFVRQIITSENWRMIQQASQQMRNIPNRFIRDAGLDEIENELSQAAGNITKGISQTASDLSKEVKQTASIQTDLGLSSITKSPKEGEPDLSNWTTSPSDLSAWTTPPTVDTQPSSPAEGRDGPSSSQASPAPEKK